MPRGHDGILHRLRWPLTGIAFVFVAGLVGYRLLGFPIVDAISNTVLVLTTVGFSAREPLSEVDKLFTDAIALLGVSAYLAILALSAAALADGQFGIASRRRRAERRIRRLSGHTVVAAYGRVGRAVAAQLREAGIRFCVVDRLESLEPAMREDGVAYLIADPTQEEALRRAGIERARALISAVDNDADSVFITLTARAMNPDLFIVARASAQRTPDRLYRAGADRVVSPYVSSGRHMAHLAMRPKIVDYLEILGADEHPLRIEEVVIDEGAPALGQPVEGAFDGLDVLVVRRADGVMLAPPEPGTTLARGDLVVLLDRGDGTRHPRA